MTEFKERYINPFTDFGFKKLFGEEPNKELLLDFLNELLREEEGEIKELTYLKNEHVGSTALDRKAIFDLYCENEKGEKFIVELQKTKQNFFKDRTLYYTTFPIREQAKRADWNYELKSVYTIGILDFVFDEDKAESEKYRYDVKLIDQETCKVFYDKLTFIYLEMPKFNKSLEEISSRFEKWLYVIRNLNTLHKVPEKLQERIFERFFETAEITKMNPEELIQYEDSLKYYRDLKNSLDTAREEGREEGLLEGREEGLLEGREEGLLEGREEGLLEGRKEGLLEGREEGKVESQQAIVRKMLKLGIDVETISQSTGLPISEIHKLS